MAAGAAQRPSQRKRNRKRKRRNVSSSSESSDISSSSESENENEKGTATIKLPQKRAAAAATSGSSSSSSSSSESEADSSSDTDSDSSAPAAKPATKIISEPNAQSPAKPARKPRAPSPEPLHNVPAPNILQSEKEEALRARFRQFWMGSVADAFADDLNEIRKEPNLTPSRLSLLIDSLAAGADVYASSSGPDGKQTNEMEVVLGE